MPIPPFQSKQTMPVPAPTAPWATVVAVGVLERTAGVGRLHLHHARVVQPAVVALAHHRDHDVLDAHRGLRLHRRRHRAVVDAPDRHRRGQVDGVETRPHSRISCDARQLAGTVEHRDAGAAAGSAHSVSGSPGRIAVTPVRATPRPAGGSGSSRTTVTWPTRTPATSAIELVGPGSSVADAKAVLAQAAGARPYGRTLPRVTLAAWDSRCPWSGAIVTGCTTRAARSGWACARPGTELPERAERIREHLEADGARFVDAEPQPDDAVTSVHDPALVDYLASAWDDWEAAGLTEDPGQDRVVPYLFPHPGLFADGRPPPRRRRRSRPAPASSPTTR